MHRSKLRLKLRGSIGVPYLVVKTRPVCDLTDFGQQTLHGVQACAAAYALGDLNPVGHHVTDVILADAQDGCVHGTSKGIGVSADGTCGSVTYEDTIVRGQQGWRISRRKVLARRVPLGGSAGGQHGQP